MESIRLSERCDLALPLPGESAGEHFRYSGANTQTLVLATQYVSGMRWQTLWNERVWSKRGAKNAVTPTRIAARSSEAMCTVSSNRSGSKLAEVAIDSAFKIHPHAT
jgi:CubicO group peptidase (beta-lactamase class C family)